MILVGLFVAVCFFAAGALAYKVWRDARQREADREARRLPPFISTHWKDRQQRLDWHRLTAEQRQQMATTLHRISDWGPSYG